MKNIFTPYSKITSANFRFAASVFKFMHVLCVIGLIFGISMVAPPFFYALINGEMPGVGLLYRGYVYFLFPFLLYITATIGMVLISIENALKKDSLE